VPTDLHCHILPNVDDGPSTLQHSVDLARQLVAGGIERVCATPHVNHHHPTSAETMLRRVELVRVALNASNIPLAVEMGAEVAASQVTELSLSELRGLTLGGSSWLLLEAPLADEFPVELVVEDLQNNGLEIVLAHPERCRLFQRAPDRVAALVDGGARVSVTSGALVGRFGRRARSTVERLIADGLVHNVVSDAHDVVRRPATLVADLEAAGLGDRLSEWTEALPDAILDTKASARATG
jgi:protein-tyrosine phosphatase